MADKTHWKKIVSDPNYLGEADFNEGEEKIATIARVARDEVIQTAEGKSKKAVVYFREQLKPMILNVARSKAIEKVAKTSGQYSFEERMGCGFGACMGCSCKTKYGNKRICKDGPVLEREEIIW